jgi:murein endopeptidase
MLLASPLAAVLSAVALTPLATLSECDSRAVGAPWDGTLSCGVQLQVASTHFVTWDNALQIPYNRPWRRWGTARLVATVERIAADYHARYGRRIVVGDLSRPRGGAFGPEFGGEGHASHQNGLDVDIYYPRRDGAEVPPFRVAEVHRRRAQWLVDRAARDAGIVFTGPNLRLRRRSSRVRYLGNHDDHLHLRLRR